MLTLLLLTISLAAIAASIFASAHRPVPVVEALPLAALGLRWSRVGERHTRNGKKTIWTAVGGYAPFSRLYDADRDGMRELGFSWADGSPCCWEPVPAPTDAAFEAAFARADVLAFEKERAARAKATATRAAVAPEVEADRLAAVDALRASLKDKPWAWSHRKADLARGLLKGRPSERDARLAMELVAEVEVMVEGVLARVGSERIEAWWERAADPVVRAAALSACRVLSALDEDHASIENSVRWSKTHSHSGHVLSGLDALDQTQASQALRAVYAHRRQLPRELREAVLGAGV